ncbi:MAG: glycosyltransferase [Gemmatimonadales bacterium]
MRIVSVAHAYPRWEGDIAGAFIERLAIALQNRAHEVTMVVPSDQGQGGTATQNGVTVRRVRYAAAASETLAYRGQMADAASSARGKFTFASLILAQAGGIIMESRSAQTDLTHAHWWLPGGVSAWLAHLVEHRPYVVTLHGTDVAILARSRHVRSLARLVLRRAGAVTAVSSFLAQEVATIADIDASSILVQPMPVSVERYGRRSVGGGGIVTVGRLVRQKRIDVILEAVCDLRQVGLTCPLTIVGDGPERRALEYRASQLGLADVVEFVGTVEPDRVPEAIGDADILAFAAVGEGLGLVAAEAMMLGVPVVAARDGGGVTDIVPETGAGRLVDGTDRSAWARAIRELLADPSSRDAAFDLGTTLKKKLAPAHVAKRYEEVYDRAVGSTGAAGA